MKRLVMVLALAAGLNAVALAQDVKRGDRKQLTPEQRAEKRTERMAKSLQLTDDQKKQLLEVNTESAIATKKINDEKRAQLKAVHQQREEKLKSVLTPAQLEKLKEQRIAHRKMMKEKRAGMRERSGANSWKKMQHSDHQKSDK